VNRFDIEDLRRCQPPKSGLGGKEGITHQFYDLKLEKKSAGGFWQKVLKDEELK
jgi:hypothetical protein